VHIPLPGLNLIQLMAANPASQSGAMGVLNMLSGGALAKYSILTLGILPYISASIVVQLLGFVIPALESLKKDGESGKRKMASYTRMGAVALSLIQSYGIAKMMESNGSLVLHPGFFFEATTMMTLTAGAIFVMWLGEQITERGLGNGISLIIFAGIAASVPSAIGATIELTRTGGMSIFFALITVVVIAAVTYFVVFTELGLRKVTINYARPQTTTKVYGTQVSNLPLKLNMAGVIPAVFASTFISIPSMLSNFTSDMESFHWLKTAADAVGPGQPLYFGVFAATIIFFCFFYTALVFNTSEISDSLKKSGAFVPGIRPGEQTAKYLDKILTRLTLVGSLYVTLICLLPDVLTRWYNLPFRFGGTSLLIIVVVAMDLKAQVRNYFASHQYGSLLHSKTK
jgi:preprotein translocase subunit SecY